MLPFITRLCLPSNSWLVYGAAALLAACGGGGGDSADNGSPGVSSLSLNSTSPKYGQTLLVTVNGSRLDQDVGLVAAGCSNAARSTAAPFVSNASTAYFTCTVSAVGAGRVDVVTAGGSSLASAGFTVAEPQVTLTLRGGGVDGDVVLTLDPTRAPITVDNFLGYVNAGFYAGTIVHRVVPGFLVQGGGFLPLNGSAVPVAKATRPPITLEVGTGLSNLQWTVAMARPDPADSATSQFFINLVDNPSLDASPVFAGYAVFGRVSAGTAVVASLTSATCGPALPGISGCAPSPDVVIIQAEQTR